MYVLLYAYKSEMNTSENRYVVRIYIYSGISLIRTPLGQKKGFLIREVS